MNKQLLIILDKKLKDKFYGFCHELKMTPMRTIIILIQLFIEGQINSKEVLSRYNSFYQVIHQDRLKNLKENRVSGDVAHKINKESNI